MTGTSERNKGRARAPKSGMLLAAALLFTASIASAQGTGAQVDALFAKWSSHTSPGCAVAVMKDGKVMHENAYGMADLDHSVPNTPLTVFHAASVSKQFTAAALLLLVQEGKVSLDDPVRKYIPELPDFGVPLTVRHLLHHTGGLRDQWDLLEIAGWRYSLDLITDDDVMALVSRQRALNFAPGSRFSYSNTGYTLLAQIVRRVSGESLRDFTNRRIFGPLEMRRTHFRDDHAEIVPDIAYGYVRKGDAFKLSVTNFDTVGATSLLTTVGDLARWDENFYSARVGGASLIARMQERGVLNNGTQLVYAAGLHIDTYRGLRTVTHGGSDAGYRSALVRFPDQHFGVACLCNIAEANPSDLAMKIADIYLAGKFTDKPSAATLVKTTNTTVPAAILASDAGTYAERNGNGALRAAVRGGSLIMSVSVDEDEVTLTPLGKGRYGTDHADVTVEFVGEGAGEVRSVSIRDSDDPVKIYDRVPDYAPTAAQLAEYAGAYTSDELDVQYRVAFAHGTAVLSSMKLKGIALEPFAPNVFRALGFGSVRFLRDSGGRVSGFLADTHRVENLKFSRWRAD
ncbi:MAG: serine hydrolase domain-containing protein [Gammaproteobacteria bacterium]